MGKLVDLTGKKFGRLTVTRRNGSDKRKRAMWLCKCGCGNKITVRGTDLTNGKTKSCGCLRKDFPNNFHDLTGQRFHRLLVLERAENDKTGHTIWKCQCDCGKITYFAQSPLVEGRVKSCGCYQRENNLRMCTKHNMRYNKLYSVWCGMKNRCYNPNASDYERYGARGIKICDEWKNNFEKFSDWALNNGYLEGLTIDRRDTNGNYEPSNCRWVDLKTQANNKRNNRYITYNGETKTLTQWCEQYGLNYGTVKSRLYKGWTVEDAFFKPIQK